MRNESTIRLFNIVRENKYKSYKWIPYDQQLLTIEWKYYRLYVAVVKKFTCELCGERFYKGFNIHHKHYINGLMAWQYDLIDVMFLCSLHHFKVHRPEIMEKQNKGIKSIKDICNG